VRRHDERGLGAAAVLQHQTGSLGVDPKGLAELVVATAEVRQVGDVREVIGQVVELSGGDVERADRDADVLDLTSRPRRSSTRRHPRVPS
jgi:hypothetical protein